MGEKKTAPPIPATTASMETSSNTQVTALLNTPFLFLLIANHRNVLLSTLTTVKAYK
jgi:hypothetical protein